jgi:neurotransmitter:Na+ symporter, NSS family
MKRGSWRTTFGFYLRAIGMACSLGNLWRFPFVTGENGGGAFVLLYVFVTLAVGMPMLIGELMFGKYMRKSVLVATRSVSETKGKVFRWSGRLAVILSLCVLAYYSVISGWVLHFITQFVAALFTGQLRVGIESLMGNGILQWALASVHIVVTTFVVTKGVQEGLEKRISSLMPLFAVLVVTLTFETMSLPSAPEVLRFLFYPDFSKLSWASLNHAIGHAFFTLSVGFGTMVTFGSYMNESDHIPTMGFRVALISTLVSVFAGLLVFPIAFQVMDRPLTDPALLFEVLPRFMTEIKGGYIFGLAFFVSLYLAALNASIGLLENILSNWLDLSQRKISRSSAVWKVGAVVLLLALFPALSEYPLGNVKLGEKSLIESLDSLLVNWCLPIVALFLLVTIRKGMKIKEFEKNFIDKNHPASIAMYSHWRFVINWLAPGLVILGITFQIISLFTDSF